ncbi:ExbD/TolR family protein [Vibrio salilacus]|uniref:ExbD/TolR family protein n=1 Tax=Vibrio salilacus TaxID=1323749 RepID=UPI000C296234|nr:biopolymer transporter ExbD [Vibrio salilacus]
MIKAPKSDTLMSSSPDLTPLLDIIFIVMVFLMLTAAVKLESLEVDLPASDSPVTSAVESDSLTINILANQPHWAINGKTYIDWQNFTLALLEAHHAKKQPIAIAADRTADVQYLVKLLGFLQQNGIQATQLLTEEK